MDSLSPVAGSGSVPMNAQVSLQKSAAKQQEAVVGKLLDSTASCAPCAGKGGLVNIKA
jgi:hypothetical protein